MTFPRLVLGIDPGPTSCGWAVLDFSIRTAPVWVAGGSVADVAEMLEPSFPHLMPEDTLVVVEEPRAMHNPLANVAVMGTAFAAGDAHGFARALGFTTQRVGVNQWRLAVVGSSKRGDNVDRKVERVLRAYVRGMPTRTSVHARDAAGVAWAGLLVFQHHPPQINVRAKPLSRKTGSALPSGFTLPAPVRLTHAQRATLAADRARTVAALTSDPSPERDAEPDVAGAIDHADEDRR
jgi:Holliday junction resolvasome RuvABC endonuclease subunit